MSNCSLCLVGEYHKFKYQDKFDDGYIRETVATVIGTCIGDIPYVPINVLSITHYNPETKHVKFCYLTKDIRLSYMHKLIPVEVIHE